MLYPSELQQLAAEHVRAMEERIAHHHLLSQLPRRTPRWRRRLGDVLLRIGTRLSSRDAAVTTPEHGLAATRPADALSK